MIKKREKRIRKLRHNHLWISLVAFLFVCVAGVVVLLILVNMMVYYIINAKVDSQFAVVKNMEAVYSETVKQEDFDKVSLEKILVLSNDSFAVLDKDGNLKLGNNCDDLGEFEGEFSLEYSEDEILLYKHPQNSVIYVQDENIHYSLNVFDIVKQSVDALQKIDPDTEHDIETKDDQVQTPPVDFDEYEDIEAYYSELDKKGNIEFNDLLSRTVVIPLWLGIRSVDDDVVIAKSPISLNINDFTLIIFIIVTVSVLASSIFIIFLVSGIVTVANQKRNINLYFTDTITGGNNRNMYHYNGEKLLKKRKNLNKSYAVVSLLFVKYNNFCLCHSMEEGEKILTKMYKILNSNMSKGEIAAHMTISEFALLLNYQDKASLEERLRKIIGELNAIDKDHNFVFHVGIKVVPPAREVAEDPRRQNFDLELEYNNACTARIPRDDKDDNKIYFFDQQLIEEQQWEDKISERQNKAVENEEFVVYYQPKYDPKTDELSGAEALIRWNSPNLGFVSPGRFIPQFEKSGFITEIDHYMLKHVAQDQKRWLDAGYSCVPVSVNVSRAHFIETDLAEQIRDIVDTAGAPRNLIEIELTESAFFDDKNALISTIMKLKEYGFIVSMDDFGSGFSSLNSLKDLPLDVLKLDAGFFSGDISDDRSGIVVSETIRLAKSLNMKTVAEGVELKEQVEFLAAKGCDMIQGYFYAKPMPASEFEELFSKNS